MPDKTLLLIRGGVTVRQLYPKASEPYLQLRATDGEAEALCRRDIEIERKEAQRGHLDVRKMAYTLADYGGLLDQRRDKNAEGYLREGLHYASKLTGKDRVIVAMLYNDLGDVA